jgi:hypothetical protein
MTKLAIYITIVDALSDSDPARALNRFVSGAARCGSEVRNPREGYRWFEIHRQRRLESTRAMCDQCDSERGTGSMRAVKIFWKELTRNQIQS